MKKKNTVTKVKYVTEEQKEVRKFIIVLLGVIIAVLAIYFFSRMFITKDLFDNNKTEYKDGVVNYDVTIVGNMLNKPYDEYYVIAFSSEDNKANYYNSLVDKYKSKDSSLKIYFLDTNNKLNEKYVAKDDRKPSTKFTNIDELSLGEITLMKIKKGKVEFYKNEVNEVKEELTK